MSHLTCMWHVVTCRDVSLAREHLATLIFVHNLFLKQNTNQASHCLDFYLSIVLFVKGVDTSNQL